jgi:hypothetical protein
LKDNFEGGATWAYEVGSQSMVCPIIVEDLNTPRQMLIEVMMVLCRYIKFFGSNFHHLYNLFAWLFLQMLCEERGFFLEIADLIRGLGLTILKGVMESHNDKIWARFIVEVILHKSHVLTNLEVRGFFLRITTYLTLKLFDVI